MLPIMLLCFIDAPVVANILLLLLFMGTWGHNWQTGKLANNIVALTAAAAAATIVVAVFSVDFSFVAILLCCPKQKLCLFAALWLTGWLQQRRSPISVCFCFCFFHFVFGERMAQYVACGPSEHFSFRFFFVVVSHLFFSSFRFWSTWVVVRI